MPADRNAQVAVAWGPLVAVLAVIALLAGGWPLASAPLSDTAPVAAGTPVSVGPDDPATVTVAGDGWQVRQAATNPDEEYVLTRNNVELSIRHFDLASTVSADDLWSGLQRVTRAGGGRLGEPGPTRTRAGVPGQSGPLSRGDRTGTAYAFPAPDGDFAMELTVLAASQAAAGDRDTAARIVASLTFRDGDT